MSFSKKELIDQLKYDGFNENIAAKAVESLTVDYNEQAVKKAKTYLSVMSMSKKELITQLEHDGFTKEQAAYGVNKS